MPDTSSLIHANRFIEPEIEAKYQHEKQTTYRKKTLLSGQFLVAFGGFSLAFINLLQQNSTLFSDRHYWLSTASGVLYILSGIYALYLSRRNDLSSQKVFGFFFIFEILFSISLGISLSISFTELHTLFIFHINISLFAFYFFFPTTFKKKLTTSIGISLIYLVVNYKYFQVQWVYHLGEAVLLGLLNLMCARTVLQLENSERKEFYIKQRLETEIEEHIHTRFELERLVVLDPLTNVYNRRYFQQKYQEAFYNAERYDQHFGMIIIDLDHFKLINDRFGHQVGDETLKWFSQLASSGLRDSDVFARFGGEEFVLLLPGTHLEGVLTVARRIQTSLRQQPMYHDNQDLKVTTSMGATVYCPHTSADDLLGLADEALYKAKANGRDQIDYLLAPNRARLPHRDLSLDAVTETPPKGD